MDRIDRQVVHCLQHDGRASFERIAAAVGVSAATVARRYHTMRREGVIQVATTPDPRASVEHTWFARLVVVPSSVAPVAESLADRPDVSWVSLVAGGNEITCFCRIDPRRAGARNLLEILAVTSQVVSFSAAAMMQMYIGGAAEWNAFADALTEEQLRVLAGAQRDDFQSSTQTVELGPEDDALLAELARDGRAKPTTLARSLGWSRSRTAARLDELFAAGLLHTEVDIATDVLDSRAGAYLWMVVSPGELDETARTLAAQPETSFAAAVTGPANLLCAVNCHGMQDLFRFITSTIGALPAVRSTEVTPVVRRVKQARARVRRGRLSV